MLGGNCSQRLPLWRGRSLSGQCSHPAVRCRALWPLLFLQASLAARGWLAKQVSLRARLRKQLLDQEAIFCGGGDFGVWDRQPVSCTAHENSNSTLTPHLETVGSDSAVRSQASWAPLLHSQLRGLGGTAERGLDWRAEDWGSSPGCASCLKLCSGVYTVTHSLGDI